MDTYRYQAGTRYIRAQRYKCYRSGTDETPIPKKKDIRTDSYYKSTVGIFFSIALPKDDRDDEAKGKRHKRQALTTEHRKHNTRIEQSTCSILRTRTTQGDPVSKHRYWKNIRLAR